MRPCRLFPKKLLEKATFLEKGDATGELSASLRVGYEDIVVV